MTEYTPMFLVCFILLWTCQFGSGSGSIDTSKRYDNYKIFKVTPENAEQIQILRDLPRMHNDYDWVQFWQDPTKPDTPINLMVSPHDMNTLIDILRSHRIHHQLHIEDVQHLIENGRHRDEFTSTKRGEYNFEHYQTYDEIVEFMEDLVTLYNSDIPIGLHVSTEIIAQSYEGRQIHLLKLGAGEFGHKPIIWMMGGLHAREWIGPATLMYIARQLARDWQSGEDKIVRRLLLNFDWYILPVFNVDGYEYSWKTDRLWRKTRSPVKAADKDSDEKTTSCFGVDANRNWDFHWNEGGAGKNECDNNYAGTKAFSETEVKQIANYLVELNTRNDIVAFLDIHSYGQMWMSPFGYSDTKPDDFEKHMQLANQATNALSDVHGTHYTVGNIAGVIYKASGNSVDWAYGELGVEFSYAVELPDNGTEGFLLQPEHITRVGQETYQATKETALTLLKLDESRRYYWL